jgi:hypothetical protein
MKRLGIAAITLGVVLIVSGCSAEGEDLSARSVNCSTLESFFESDPNMLHVQNSWNTYEFYEYLEQGLWTKLSNADEPSFNALMELRRIEYSQNLYEPPALGRVITYDPESQTNDAVKIQDFVEDSKKEEAVDQAKALCPGLDVQWWDSQFYIRDFAF